MTQKPIEMVAAKMAKTASQDSGMTIVAAVMAKRAGIQPRRKYRKRF
jgi:hypothetical protein